MKPCPFCGGEAELNSIEDGGDFYVYCRSLNGLCATTGAGYGSPSEAIAAWNRRADGWVSVEERLLIPTIRKPGSERRFIVAAPHVTVCYWEWDTGLWRFTNGKLAERVTHWQPLPDPPKEET